MRSYFLFFISFFTLVSCEKSNLPEDVSYRNIKSLNTVWTAKIPDLSLSSGDYLDKTVPLNDGGLLLSSIKRLSKLDSSGKILWSIPDILCSEMVETFSGDIITSAYVEKNSSYLYCISPDGNIKWSRTTSDNGISSLALGYDGNVYAFSYNKGSAFSNNKAEGVIKISLINLETGDLSIISEFPYDNDPEREIRFGEGKLYVPNSTQVVLVTSLLDNSRHSSSFDHFDICLLVINTENNQIIKKRFGGFKSDSFKDFTASPDGSLYILGITNSRDGDVKSYYNYEKHSGGKPWIIKLNSDYNIVWEKVLLLHGDFGAESIAYGSNSIYLTVLGNYKTFFYGIVKLDNSGGYNAVAFDYGPHDYDDIALPSVNYKGEAYFYCEKITDSYYNTKSFWISKKVIDGN